VSVRPRRILIGVTSDVSLVLMRGLPEFLVAEGWDVHIVTSPGPLLASLGSGVRVHEVPMRRDPAPAADLRALVGWIRVMRRVRPDVTLVGTPKAGLLGGLSAYLCRVPLRVYHLRGLRLETSRGLARRILSSLEHAAGWFATDILAVSTSLRQRYIDLGLAPQEKIVVLGKGSSNGVDTTRFRPGSVSETRVTELRANLGLHDGTPVIGFVGRLNRDKGLSVLATASSELQSRGLAHQLLVVGGIDNSAGAETGALDSAIQTGHVDDPRAYYALMDLLCLPTLREGFPNVVLEAAAMGLPAVTTDATGAVDSVRDGATGWICRAGDPASLAAALSSALRDTDRRRSMGENARSDVETHFERTAVWRRLAQFLQTNDARASGRSTPSSLKTD
jgi:glycosyltransferase involved in cell wall biosynthesis